MAVTAETGTRPISDAVLRRCVPFLVAWAFAARYPSFDLGIADQDESYYLMQGGTWIHGDPPYTALWDIKPPGLILIFAVLRLFATPGILAVRIATSLAVLAGAIALYRFARHHLVGRWTPFVVALLYPPFTTVLWGVSSPPEPFMVPFVIGGLDIAAGAWSSRERPSIARCALAGLLFGCAISIKQSAVFEMALAFGVLATSGGLKTFAPRQAATFVAMAAAPSLIFLAWAITRGVDPRLYLTPYVTAVHRLSGDGISFGQGLLRFLPMFKPILPLFVAALLLIPLRDTLRRSADRRAVLFVVLWVAASSAGIIAVRSMYAHYYLTMVAPLALCAALWLRTLTEDWSRRQAIGWVLAGLAVAFPLIWAPLVEIPDMRSADLPKATAAALHTAGIEPGQSLYVADQDPEIYQLSGAKIPTRYAFSQHLMCDFTLPDTDPETEIRRIMATKPGFVVVNRNRRWMDCERKDRLALVDGYLAQGYDPAGKVDAGGESVDIYRLKDQPPSSP